MYSINILIIDDIKNNTCHLKELILDSFDSNIFTSSDLDIAKQIVFDNSIDIILVGMDIEQSKCLSFIEQVKDIKQIKDVPIFCIRDIYEINKVSTSSFAKVEYIPYLQNDALLIRKLKLYISIFNEIKESNRKLNRSNNILVYSSKMNNIAEIIKLIYEHINLPFNVISSRDNDIKISNHFNNIVRGFKNNFSLFNKKQLNLLNNSVDGFLEIFDNEKNVSVFSLNDSINDSIKLLQQNNSLNDLELKIEKFDDIKCIGIKLELCQVIINCLLVLQKFHNKNKTLNPIINIELKKSKNQKELIFYTNLNVSKIDISNNTRLKISKIITKKSFNGKFKVENKNNTFYLAVSSFNHINN